MSLNRIETSDDLEKILAQQNELISGMADLVKAMDARIKLLTALIDNHHDLFIKHGLAMSQPKGIIQ